MGYDLGKTINNTAARICNSRPVNAVVSNPLYMALLLTAAAVIIVLAMYRGVLQEGKKRLARTALYILLVMTAMCFIHHYAVNRRCASTAQQQTQRSLIEAVSASTAVGGEYPVTAAVRPVPPVQNVAPSAAGAVTGAGPNPVWARPTVPGVNAAVGGAPQYAGQSALAPLPPTRPDNLAVGGAAPASYEQRFVLEDLTVPATVR